TFSTLSSVVAFYNGGGGSDVNKDPVLKPLGLTTQEQIDLVTLLESLSGEPLTGPEFVWEEAIPTEYEAIEDWLEKSN
ncbi:MAG: cytochrome-c peroxidase, partial [Alphaproteobacteria bacterium]